MNSIQKRTIRGYTNEGYVRADCYFKDVVKLVRDTSQVYIYPDGQVIYVWQE